MKARASIARSARRGQATVEYALVYAGVLLPVTFMLIFTSQLLWAWHSIAEFTREGARYASTHCWQGSGDNVRTHMRANVPVMVDRDQFVNGEVDIQVQYFARDPDTGQLAEFTCDGAECSTECVPDAVIVRIQNYEFRRFMSFLGLPAVAVPDFQTSLPMESAGCDPELGSCQS